MAQRWLTRLTSPTPKCRVPTGWEEHPDTLATMGCLEGTARMEKMDKRETKESQVYKVSKGTRVKRVPQVQKDREDFQDTWG